MTTQIIEASQGLVTNEMSSIAQFEAYSEEYIRNNVSNGEIVILKNNQRKNSESIAIGKSLGLKITTSFDISSPVNELCDMFKIIKLSGGHTIIENGACEGLAEKREKLLLSTTLPYGTVPIYQSSYENYLKNKTISKLTKKKILADIEAQASAGVDFVVLNASLTSELSALVEKSSEKITSQSAKIVSYYMKSNDKENPYYESFEEVLDILRTYDVALCFELALKNSSACEILGNNQLKELMIVGDLIERARNSGVQVFVDALGVVSVNNAEFVIKTVKKLIKNAPIMATNVKTVNSENSSALTGVALANMIFGYYGADFVQTVELPKTTGYFNAKLLKEAIESALTVAKSVDYAKGNEKASNFEIEFCENIQEQEYANANEYIRALFS